MDTTTLDAILGGDTPSAAPPSTPPQGDATAASQQTQQANPVEPSKAEVTDGATPSEKPKEKSDVDKAFAAMSKQIRELKQKVLASNQPKQEPQILDPVAMDPADFDRGLKQTIFQEVTKSRLQTAMAVTSDKYTDFDDMIQVFDDATPSTPGLWEEMLAARNPAEFAYKWAKEFKARQEIGDPVQYAEKIRQETIAKTMADLNKIVDAKVNERLAGILPSSLAETQSQGGRVSNPDGFNGPTPLSDILKKR